MSKSGVTVSQESIESFNDLKLGKKLKYIIYKLSDDYTEIVVEDKSAEDEWDVFRSKLLSAKSVHKGKESNGPRYAVYDFEYDAPGGEGRRNVIAFIAWSPDEGAAIYPKMTYASSKEGLRRALNGVGAEVQANREDDIEYDSMLKDITRGKR